MKKLLVLGMFILCVIGLVGCSDDKDSTTVTDLEAIENVLNTLTIEKEVNSDFSITTAKDNVAISWASNDENSIKIENDLAKVTQSETDINVTLTATGTKGEDSAKKEFSLKVLKQTGADQTPDTTSVTIAQALEKASNELEEQVTIKGVTVQAVVQDGAFITDGKDMLFLYVGSNASLEVEAGKVYDITGETSVYNNLEQLKNATAVESNAEATQYNGVKTTIPELNSDLKANGLYTITATVTSGGFTDGEGNSLKLSSKSPQTSIDALNSVLGATLEIDIYLNINGSWTNGWQVYFVGTTDDLKLNDNLKLQADFDSLTIVSETLENLTLPTTGNFGSTITWSSDNTSVIANDGTVTRQETDVIVKLTATLTLGSETPLTKEFNVKVISSTQTVSNNLFISEYSEGDKGNNKYIEIYNPSTDAVDLSGYSVKKGSNGSVINSIVVELSGTLNAGEVAIVYYIDGSDADLLAAAEAVSNKFPTTKLNFNGDDAVGLYKGEELIDMIGFEDGDPGAGWTEGDVTTINARLIRKAGYGASTTFKFSEWECTPIPDKAAGFADNIGTHTFA